MYGYCFLHNKYHFMGYKFVDTTDLHCPASENYIMVHLRRILLKNN